MRILGIDPGLRTTGFGVIDKDGARLSYVASGTIKTDAVDIGQLPARLKIIFDGVREIDELFADGTISGGMLPKIGSALDAAKNGVNTVHIIDGRVPHSMLLEVLTEQAYGTMIRSH